MIPRGYLTPVQCISIRYQCGWDISYVSMTLVNPDFLKRNFSPDWWESILECKDRIELQLNPIVEFIFTVQWRFSRNPADNFRKSRLHVPLGYRHSVEILPVFCCDDATKYGTYIFWTMVKCNIGIQKSAFSDALSFSGSRKMNAAGKGVTKRWPNSPVRGRRDSASIRSFMVDHYPLLLIPSNAAQHTFRRLLSAPSMDENVNH